MELQPYEIDSSTMPVKLGSALRVPSYAWLNWGLPVGHLREESDKQYEIEWKGGTPQQMQYVIDAVTRSGMGNYSQMLRDANARVISRLLRDLAPLSHDGRINYLETGAGVSTLTLYNQLEQDGYDVERIFATLIEPSWSRLSNIVAELEKKGLKANEHFRYLAVRDIDVPEFIIRDTQDVVSSVATIHHHAYLDTPIKALVGAMRKGGFVVLADWHNSMWEHPNRVYEFLKNDFEWPTKEKDLRKFAEMYPQALEPAPVLTGPAEEANIMIRRFWKGWEDVRKKAKETGNFNENDDIFMHEAHSPVERYLSELLSTMRIRHDTPYLKEIMTANPWPLLPTSSLLQATVGQKI